MMFHAWYLGVSAISRAGSRTMCFKVRTAMICSGPGQMHRSFVGLSHRFYSGFHQFHQHSLWGDLLPPVWPTHPGKDILFLFLNMTKFRVMVNSKETAFTTKRSLCFCTYTVSCIGT